MESLYENILDRPGEEAGIAFWTAALDEGRAQRAETVIGFSESPEHIVQMATNVITVLWSSHTSRGRGVGVFRMRV